MKLVLPLVLLLVGLGAGVGVGLFFGSGTAPSAEITNDTVGENEGAGAEAGTEPEGSSTQGDGLVSPANAGTEYVRLRNQFIVPVVRHGSVRSLVILVLTVEATTGGSDAVFEHEPRLRDSFLRVLFAHANSGGFDGQFTESAAMAPLRAGLRDAAIGVLGDVARDVLIVDITRQDA
jgi:flagellar FliL protein